MEVTLPSLYSLISYYLLGLLGAFAPCAYPLIPVLVVYLVGSEAKKGRGVVAGILFSMGLTLSVGALALLTLYAQDVARRIIGSFTVEEVSSVSLFVLFVLGFLMLTPFKDLIASVSVPLPKMRRGGLLLAVPLGVLFFIASAPCDGAYIVALALNAASQPGNPWVTISLLSLAFGIGMSTPFIIMSAAASRATSLYRSLGKSILVKRSGVLIGIALMVYSYSSMLIVGVDTSWLAPYASRLGPFMWALALAYLALSSLKAGTVLRSKASVAVGIGAALMALGYVLPPISLPLQLPLNVPELVKHAGSIALFLALTGLVAGSLRAALVYVGSISPELAPALAWFLLYLRARSTPVAWAAAGFLLRGLLNYTNGVPWELAKELDMLVRLILASLELSTPFMIYSVASRNMRGAREISKFKKS